MPSGIYKLSWPNGYFYLGQAINLNRRKNDHFASMQRGRHHNPKIQSLFKKYGIPAFEILEYCSIKELNDKEQALIDVHFGNSLCCNLRPEVRTMLGYTHTDETKAKISKAFKGKIVSEETRHRHSAANKKRIENGYIQIVTEESRKKMSDKRRLEKHPRAKKVINTKTGVIYECAKIVSILFGVNYSTLRDYLQNKKPNKTTFKYVESTN